MHYTSSSSGDLSPDFEIVVTDPSEEHPLGEEQYKVKLTDIHQPRPIEANTPYPYVSFVAPASKPVFSLYAQVRIKVPAYPDNDPAAVAECKKWKVKVRQDVLSSSDGEVKYTNGSFMLTATQVPGNDGPESGDTQSFQGNSDNETVEAGDNPGYPETAIFVDSSGKVVDANTEGAGVLLHANRSDVFITRLYEVRDSGEIHWHKWIRWEASWDVSFNPLYDPNSGVTTLNTFINSWNIQILDQGDGPDNYTHPNQAFTYNFGWIPG